ncbi:MAG: NAD(P)/FAD-dependent oxidoreductase [Bacteroidota bacterium]
MIRPLELVFLPEEAADKTAQLEQAANSLNVSTDRIRLEIRKRSIDARGRKVKIRLFVDAYVDEEPPSPPDLHKLFPYNNNCNDADSVVIVGFGPAGMFAALRLIELGKKPVIIERGKDIRSRRRDLALLNREGIVDPDSNYCFGEGGAGTYSDGKLYTRSGKRGDIQRILSIFVRHGADPSILIDAHPHIGTNKLPGIVQAIRETILSCGGEVHFNTRMTGLLVTNGKVNGVMTRENVEGAEKEIIADKVILATGHSARDIYALLAKQDISIHSKPFALGVRIEHPQEIIDRVQYHCDRRSPFLPPASYSLTTQSDGRGVYSFCMCPGGIIAPASTSPGELVVNGWSPSKRNNLFANSGMVVSVDEKDFEPFKNTGPLSGMKYQEAVERKCFDAGGGRLVAPAQRMIDFIEKKTSSDLPDCSYVPGIRPYDLDGALPTVVTKALRDGLKQFGQRMRPYLTNEAVLVATESRTSSPVRIPRDNETKQHPELTGLFPCGEGAGYAGGIVSAAMDGERCAEACAQ